MAQIALSKRFLQDYGAQIQAIAPDRIELMVLDDPALSGAWQDSEILISSEFAGGVTTAQVVARMSHLRWLHTIFAGMDNIPWDAVGARSIIVTNSAGVYAPMMAEYVIGMLVMLYRNLHLYYMAQQAHRDDRIRVPELPPQELYGKRMGIIGYGAIGMRLTHSANALGMRVWAMRRTPVIDANEPVERMLDTDELDEMLRECDVIAIAASLNSSTRGLLGANEFQKMKRGAVLINVARGAILDEAALVRALEQGWIRGAALDVTTIEPLPADSPLWNAPNVILTPHISGEMPIGRQRAIDLFCKNLRLYLNDQTSFLGNRAIPSAHT
ncbi:MAG: D-2-hydroxyacid dehydrogenase [Anaerolineae bacterium]|nr:D-2-hydroxyacid dehydrogenase [Anaerolineae bacterium]